jgi:glutamine amidotransferase
MSDRTPARVVIVDFGLGNLYSVKHACAHVGVSATITSSPADVLRADAIILPGVGAYGDAIATLDRLGLVTAIREFAASGRSVVGICLGMQLLMSGSEEFGQRDGLGIIPGRVTRFQNPRLGDRQLKVPQIGWNGIRRPDAGGSETDPWTGTFLDAVPDGAPMYFVHSYVVHPADTRVVLSTTRYGDTEFCSSLRQGNIMACQFHPERSGPEGLKIYRNLARIIGSRIQEKSSESVA